MQLLARERFYCRVQWPAEDASLSRTPRTHSLLGAWLEARSWDLASGEHDDYAGDAGPAS